MPDQIPFLQPLQSNQLQSLPNQQSNLSSIPPLQQNQQQRIPNLQGTLIQRLDPPVIEQMQVPVNRGLALPVFDNPNTSIKYPVINVPTQEEFDAAVKAEREKAAQEDAAKNRGLPDTKPELPPQIQALQQTPPVTKAEIPAENPSLNIAGVKVDLPDPSLVATAGSVAIVTTAATIGSTMVFNTLKNAAEPLIREAAKNKFKIKIKQVKPVLHYILTDSGKIDVFQYSSEGTKLIDTVDNVEQYLRDQVEINPLYEVENKVIVDDIISEKFTKEGQKRFKPLFAPAKKIAKKLAARLSF